MLQARFGSVAARLPQAPSVLGPSFLRAFSTTLSISARKQEAPAVAVSSSVQPTETRETQFVRSYKPRTPGLRHLRRPINDHLWKGRPFLPLTFPKKGQGKGGRNNQGRITVRHRGGGVKRRIRIVDFERWEAGPQLVERIEHDPGRSAHIALLTNKASGKKSYIVAAEGLRAGDTVQSYRAGIPQDLLDSMGGAVDPGVLASQTCHRGNCLPMHMIPIGTFIYNVGSHPRRGAVFCRSAGTYAVLVSKEDNLLTEEEAAKAGPRFVQVKLQSGEIRRVSRDACATIGVASNPHHQDRQLGKAGRKRWLNIRPTVRGVAMNRVNHPHGGGRGKSKSNRNPTSPWGKPAKGGFKTRRKRNINIWVVAARPRNMGRRRNASG